MTRPWRWQAAACLATGVALVGAAGPPPAAGAQTADQTGARMRVARPADADPLTLTIARVSPSTVPQRGRIVVAGRITNSSEATWSDLNVYLVTSSSPLKTSQELRAADQAPALAEVGQRLTSPGLFTEVVDLAPGHSTSYRLRVPRADLGISGEPGVYWLGVQVLGTSDGLRLDGADGRARTFLPLMRERRPPSTSLALLLPLRDRVAIHDDGRVEAPDVWRGTLSREGRLGRLLEFSRSSGSTPVTFVLDPAIVDVARRLASGNPGLESALGEPGNASEAGDAGASVAVAQRFLDRLQRQTATRSVLRLPYGDVDVAAAYQQSYGDLVTLAQRLAGDVLERAGIRSEPVLAPADGLLPWEALAAASNETPVVLDGRAVRGTRSSKVNTAGDTRLTLTDDFATRDQSSQAPIIGALALRQRLLARLALHAMSRAREETVAVQLPSHWDPGPAWKRAHFFAGLHVPWLQTVDAAGLVGATAEGGEIPAGSVRLRYPASALAAQLPAVNLVVAQNLFSSARTLDALLTRDSAVPDQLASAACVAASVQVRARPGRARSRSERLVSAVERVLGRVTVSGPAFVTMSGKSGPFPVTIRNGLDQPIRVGVEAHAVGTDLVHFPEVAPIDIPAGQRRTVRMRANSDSTGVWPVVLQPVDADGTALGASTEFKIRSSHVGLVIWLILGVGSVVLLLAIVFRILRQVRSRRSADGPLLGRAGS